ncbi:MAG: hypothetical protein J6X77_02950 [Bacteroidales bacterium]|nr:hypothetical protein [Bacteroidales bacterium]
MKKVILSIAAVALLFACNPNENNPGGGDQPQGRDYTDTDELVFVDMGTSVLWATMNVGAEHSTDYGTYMEWSAFTASEGDEWANCRLPSKADYEELATVKTSDGKYNSGPCRTKWGKVNGVFGLTYTNKNTGNAIFMPAAGNYSQGYPYFVGQKICNWTIDSHEEQYGLQATMTMFQEGAAPYAGAFQDGFVSIERCTVRLVKEK